MSRGIIYLSFTENGAKLAGRLSERLGGSVVYSRSYGNFALQNWTAENFNRGRALVFIGAAGIAVRAIAPHLKNKAMDPAVVVMDEAGQFAVPILAGHLGGANDLARRIADVCGAVAVITTATDVRGRFAVDEWAKRQNCAVVNPAAVRKISARILDGQPVTIRSDWQVVGKPPAGVAISEEGPADVVVSLQQPETTALWMAPRIAVLGVGCRKGVPAEVLERAFTELIGTNGIYPGAVIGAATIELKQREPGLLSFCSSHGWALTVFSADQLRCAEGVFAPSPFVEGVTGVDNVCERSAVLAANGPLKVKKTTGCGVALALAARPFHPDWRWKDA